jgi:PAS domain S-box-containing protein
MIMDSLFQALANAADGAFVVDEDQRVLYWNQAAQEILGYTSDEVVGRACYEILGGRDDSGQVVCRHHCYVATTAFTGSAVTNYDTCARTKSSEVRWINVSILTFSASDDAAPLIVHLFRDATDKKQNEQFTRQVLGAAKRLQENAAASPPALPPPAGSLAQDLTDRECEVLSLLAQGLSTRDIAQSLSISPSTARNHTQNILHKLRVHSRLEAVAYAFEHGLVNREQGVGSRERGNGQYHEE